jgi:hypothetical protein
MEIAAFLLALLWPRKAALVDILNSHCLRLSKLLCKVPVENAFENVCLWHPFIRPDLDPQRSLARHTCFHGALASSQSPVRSSRSGRPTFLRLWEGKSFRLFPGRRLDCIKAEHLEFASFIAYREELNTTLALPSDTRNSTSTWSLKTCAIFPECASVPDPVAISCATSFH